VPLPHNGAPGTEPALRIVAACRSAHQAGQHSRSRRSVDRNRPIPFARPPRDVPGGPNCKPPTVGQSVLLRSGQVERSAAGNPEAVVDASTTTRRPAPGSGLPEPKGGQSAIATACAGPELASWVHPRPAAQRVLVRQMLRLLAGGGE